MFRVSRYGRRTDRDSNIIHVIRSCDGGMKHSDANIISEFQALEFNDQEFVSQSQAFRVHGDVKGGTKT